MLLCSINNSGHRPAPMEKCFTHMGTDPYLQNLPKDQWPPEGQDLKLISTEIYQSVNPFWIIVLTPIVVGFLAGSEREKSSIPQ